MELASVLDVYGSAEASKTTRGSHEAWAWGVHANTCLTSPAQTLRVLDPIDIVKVGVPLRERA